MNSNDMFDLDLSGGVIGSLDLSASESEIPMGVDAKAENGDLSTILTAFCFCGCTGSFSSVNPF